MTLIIISGRLANRVTAMWPIVGVRKFTPSYVELNLMIMHDIDGDLMLST